MDPCLTQGQAPAQVIPEGSPLLRERIWTPTPKRKGILTKKPHWMRSKHRQSQLATPRKGSLVQQGSCWAKEAERMVVKGSG